jgi:hypothetical protein
MSATLWPVTGTFPGRALRQTVGAVWGALRSRPLGAASGVVVGTPTDITVSAASGSWSVAPHKGVLDLETNAIAGPYNYSFDTTQSGTLNAPHATLDRIDLLSITMSDTSEGDGSTAGPAITYTVGTPGSSPSAPATPAKNMPLAQIRVPHTGGGSPSVTWVAPAAVAAGGILPVPGSAQYPASPYVGQLVYDATVGGMVLWDGTGWRAFGRKASNHLTVNVTPDDTVTVHITFPTGRFTSAPEVALSVNASNPQNVEVGTANVTSTGFDLIVWSTTSAATRVVRWIASQDDV